MRRTRVTPLHYLAATDASGGVASKKKVTHANESPFYHYAQFPHPSGHYLQRQNIKFDTFWIAVYKIRVCRRRGLLKYVINLSKRNCFQWLVTLLPRILREYIQACHLNSLEAERNRLQIYYPQVQLFTCHDTQIMLKARCDTATNKFLCI
jgi:hypothetical protein